MQGFDHPFSNRGTGLSAFVQASDRLLKYSLRHTWDEDTEALFPLVETDLSHRIHSDYDSDAFYSKVQRDYSYCIIPPGNVGFLY